MGIENNFNTGLSDADLLRMKTAELDRFLSNTQLSDEQQQEIKDKRDALCEEADVKQRLQDRWLENVKIKEGNELLTGEIDRINAQLGIFVEAKPQPKS
jgi:FtsZ-binding cell division protein ZapB